MQQHDVLFPISQSEGSMELPDPASNNAQYGYIAERNVD